MDYYYSAADDAAALSARDLPGGPIPGAPGFDTVEAKDVIPCPHLEQLVGLATGKTGPSLVPQLTVLWPVPPAPGEPYEFDAGPSITRLPNQLRDDLAEVEVTVAVAAAWAEELWGFDPADARRVGEAVVRLARAAKSEARSLYWWSEL